MPGQVSETVICYLCRAHAVTRLQTAYWGLMDICEIKKGETIVVTGAAGAVGTVVSIRARLASLSWADHLCSNQACQIAKAHGLRVIAVAGGADKCKWLVEELGVDAALDYKDKNFKNDFKKTVGFFDCVSAHQEQPRRVADGD